MHHRPGDCRVYSGDRCCALRSFHSLTFLLIQPFNLIFSNGTEGVTHIRECREVVHETAIKAHGAAGEENAFHFLPLLVLLPSNRIGRLKLALVELEREGAWLIGFVPYFCGGIEVLFNHLHLRFSRTRRTRMPISASSSK